MRLLLLGTSGCHLCEDAQTLLNDNNIAADYVDIAEHEEWQAQFSVLIPVLYHVKTQRYLNWRFDSPALLSFIESLNMTNPLLNQTDLPHFSQIKPEHIELAIDELLANARKAVADCLDTNEIYTWENLIEPIENAEDRLSKAWSPVSHLNAVMNNDELRDAYNACLPKLSDYATEMGQNEKLFHAYESIASHETFSTLTKAQQKVITNALRDFQLSGVALPLEQKQRYKEISQQLSSLTSRYEENVLDATNAWTKLITDINELAGLPETALAQAKQSAEISNVENGWLITLQFPSYLAVMTYADNRELRREHYTAFVTRATENDFDNTEIMEQILALRHEEARLLGFTNYADLSLATKMANSTDEVISFLEDLATKSLPQARQDVEDLKKFALDNYGIDNLQGWDVSYLSEKMRQQHYQLSQEEVKSYFPVPHVLKGLFEIVQRLYGLQITELHEFDRWHESVQLFEICDSHGQTRGRFYLDLFARTKKRGGAWMDDCIGRRKLDDNNIQYPVAYLVCNFTPPTTDTPSLLTHDDVTTLFHEFGHGLHHVLTQVDYLGVSGISGVAWDAVELPSQFMENWCWEKDALALISAHYQTGEMLPESLFEKMLAAKNFQAGMIMVRQLEFSLFDFHIHRDFEPQKGGRIYEILNDIRQRVAVVPVPEFNRFAHSFSHIFAGGYAAGYYSYKWAEVLSSDAFSLFEEKGIFDAETGKAFLTNILEQGGSDDAMELFKNFRGREPSCDALLRHSGIKV
ncbi:MAG: oligopeptidase A [Methylococcales bacterium]|nr:oligopeptidase A [Methylococcales bacterium]MDD5754119.1 oligopeptidase A [Methylococcales bacterium]